MKSYVCCLSTDNYLDGVLVLNENLKRLRSKYPLLCIINENISEKTRDILTFFSIPFQEINNIKFQGSSNDVLYGDYGFNKDYLKNTFDKLNIFSLVEYEKLVYLDSDLLILENIDSLFEYPHLSCPKDLPFNVTKFNSGVMVLRPNLDDFHALKKNALKANKEMRKVSDQDIINEYFKGITPLDYGYNMVREIGNQSMTYFDGVKLLPQSRRSVSYFLENSEYNKIIHYIGKIKPFMISDSFDDDYSYLYQYYFNIIKRQKNLFECRLQEDLVSIIVPIYNKERYLDRCLESILNQTYSNLEIVLVNDGSSDDSLHICEKFQKNDSRLRIINQKNLGVSSARNRGISESTGQYIAFVDADDFIEPHMISELMMCMKKYRVDFVQCGTSINEERTLYCQDREVVFSNNEQVTLEFLMRNMSGTVWDKLYRREVLEGIFFDTRYDKNEDTLFVFEVMKKSHNYARIGLPLYHYSYQKEDSLTGEFSLEKDYNLLGYLDSVSEFILSHYPNLESHNDYFAFILLQFMLKEIDKLDFVSPVNREDKMIVEIIERLKILNAKVSELPDSFH